MGYLNVDAVESALANLAAQHPALAERIALPQLTVEGRSSSALRLRTTSGVAKDTLLFIGGVHGAEWGSCEILLNLAVDLIEAYEQHAGLAYGGKVFSPQEIQDLLDSHDIVLFPQVNPDGRHCSQTLPGRSLWRKNRNPARARGDAELFGVDLNRNFDFLFDLAAFAPASGVSASDDVNKPDYYQGSAAFSEPETVNVRWLLDNLPETRWFIDLHCTGQTIHYVWSDDDAQQNVPSMNFRNPAFDGARGAPDQSYREFLANADLQAMKALATCFANDLQAVRGTAYGVGPAFEITPFSGTSHDYCYARHLLDSNKGKVLSFVVEWGLLDCQPLWVDMVPIIEEVTAGLIGFCVAAQ